MVVSAVVLVFYANIFNNQFAYDDNDFFLNWPAVKSLSNAKTLLLGDLPLNHQHAYRPIRSLLQATAYQLFGQNPLGYHFLSLFLYLSAIYLIYLVFRKILSGKVAFLSAIIFAVLPVHVEAVTFITASFDLFGVVLMLASFYLFLDKSRSRIIISAILAVLAFFSYELTIILPFLIILYDQCANRGKKIIVSIKEAWLYFLGVVAYLAVRIYIMRMLSPQSFFSDMDFKTRILTSIKSFSNHLYLTIFNYPLSVNHQTVLSQSVFDGQVVFSLALIILLLCLAWRLYSQGKTVYTLLIIWFILGLIPTANLVRISRFVAERYLFLSSVSWSVFSALVFFKLFDYFSAKRQATAKIVSIIVLFFVILIYGSITYARNNDWQDDGTLWRNTLEKEAGDTRSLNNLALGMRQKGRYGEAIDYLNQAIKTDPDYYLAYGNLGEIYSELNQHGKAIENFSKAIELKPNYFAAYSNRGFEYYLLDKKESAEKDYLKALELNPRFYQANLNLGGLYFEMNDFNQAIDYFKKALAVDNSNGEVHEAMGMAYFNTNQISLARESFEKALKINPDSARAKDFLSQLK